MATPAQRTNTWTLDEWYDQAVAGTQGAYNAPNELWAWGSGDKGYSAQNSQVQYSSPIQIPGEWTKMKPYHDSAILAAIKSDSTLWVWGNNYEGGLGLNQSFSGGSSPVKAKSSPTQIPSVGGFNTWNMVATGKDECVAIKSDNSLHGWGRNSQGGLGLNSEGTAGRRSRPVQIGSDTTWSDVTGGDFSFMALKSDNTMWVWGKNESSRILGLNDDVDRSSPTQLPGSWASMNKGFRYANAAIKTDGTLWMWGLNTDGMMGQNSPEPSARSSPTQLLGTTWSKVDVGDSQAAAIKTDGTLWTWGKNEYGNLGHDTPSNAFKSSPTQVGTDSTWYDVAMSSVHTLATKTDGSVWAWGLNNQGNLGLNQPQPTIVKSPVQVGSLPSVTQVHIGGEANASFAFLQQ